MKFPNLNEFRVVYNDNRNWIAFFAKHTHLTKLYVRVTNDAFNNHITEFNFQQLAQLKNLTEFSLILPGGVIPTEEIFRFFDNHRKLTRCHFAMKRYGDNYEKLIRERVRQNWIISDFGVIKDVPLDKDLKGFSLKKKLDIF